MKRKLGIFGKKLRACRKSKGMSQEVLAEKMGLDQTLVSQIERNDGDVKLSTVLAACNALDVTFDRLMMFGK